ncbi:hypothetical protein CB1_001095032, partial [Camelus ferus]
TGSKRTSAIQVPRWASLWMYFVSYDAAAPATTDLSIAQGSVPPLRSKALVLPISPARRSMHLSLSPSASQPPPAGHVELQLLPSFCSCLAPPPKPQRPRKQVVFADMKGLSLTSVHRKMLPRAPTTLYGEDFGAWKQKKGNKAFIRNYFKDLAESVWKSDCSSGLISPCLCTLRALDSIRPPRSSEAWRPLFRKCSPFQSRSLRDAPGEEQETQGAQYWSLQQLARP